MALLEGILTRLAAQERLLMPPAAAARVVMAAYSGLALGLILRPEQFSDPEVSTQVREATLRSVVLDAASPAGPGALPAPVDATLAAAATLRARLDTDTVSPRASAEAGQGSGHAASGTKASAARFTAAEAGLLREWLGRFEAEPGAAPAAATP